MVGIGPLPYGYGFLRRERAVAFIPEVKESGHEGQADADLSPPYFLMTFGMIAPLASWPSVQIRAIPGSQFKCQLDSRLSEDPLDHIGGAVGGLAGREETTEVDEVVASGDEGRFQDFAVDLPDADGGEESVA